MRFLVIIFSSLICLPTCLFSQTQWKAWGSASLNFSFSKKLDLKVSHLRSYGIASQFENNFNQSTASLEYDITKRVSALGGIMNTQFPSIAKNSQRYFVRASYRILVADALYWSNGIQAEIHSANETRFRNRIIYITRLSNKNRIDFLNLNLSASYWLFYNIGGNTIRYFDKAGNVVARNSPDGFHRGRLFLTANSKISKQFSASVYYMRQQEFNLFTPEWRKINIVNPQTGNIGRSFDNYNVAGLSLLYDINLYKSKNK
jgi:Protein of unknown function (DUF2490)